MLTTTNNMSPKELLESKTIPIPVPREMLPAGDKCLRKLRPHTIKHLRTLQKRPTEFYGFIDDAGHLIDTRMGHPSAVSAEIIPKSDCEWHTHVLPIIDLTKLAQIPEQEQKQIRCGVNAEKYRTAIVSEADAFIAFLRPWTVTKGEDGSQSTERTHSLIVTNDWLVKYYLADEQRWREFQEWVDQEYGKSSEIDLQIALGIEASKILNKAIEQVYEPPDLSQQQFDYCADERIWAGMWKDWHAFLRDRAGLSITYYKPADWKPKLPPKVPMESMIQQLLRAVMESVPEVRTVVESRANAKKSDNPSIFKSML